MIVDVILRLPAQAQAKRHVGLELPVFLREEPHVKQVDGGERSSGDNQKLTRPAHLARTSPFPRTGLETLLRCLVGVERRECERAVKVRVGSVRILQIPQAASYN